MNIFAKWVYSIAHECDVEVLSRGHFEASVLVQLPSGRVVEVDLSDLIQRGNYEQDHSRGTTSSITKRSGGS